MTGLADDKKHETLSGTTHHTLGKPDSPQSIDWYAPGQTRVFDVEGVRILVRFVERKGRRGRIAITTMPGVTSGRPESEALTI